MDADVYDRAAGVGRFVKSAKTLLARLSPKRIVPVFFDEYNISWMWETRDVRMTNAKGATFDALTLVSATENGAASLMAWNEKDNIYGKTGDDDTRRPGAEVLHLFSTYLESVARRARGVVVFRTHTRRAVG